MRFLWKLHRKRYTNRKDSDTVLQETDCIRTLVRKLRRRQSPFFEHIIRRNKFENVVTNGKCDRQSAKRRQRNKYLNGFTKGVLETRTQT